MIPNTQMPGLRNPVLCIEMIRHTHTHRHAHTPMCRGRTHSAPWWLAKLPSGCTCLFQTPASPVPHPHLYRRKHLKAHILRTKPDLLPTLFFPQSSHITSWQLHSLTGRWNKKTNKIPWESPLVPVFLLHWNFILLQSLFFISYISMWSKMWSLSTAATLIQFQPESRPSPHNRSPFAGLGVPVVHSAQKIWWCFNTVSQITVVNSPTVLCWGLPISILQWLITPQHTQSVHFSKTFDFKIRYLKVSSFFGYLPE